MKIEEAVKKFESRFKTVMDGFAGGLAETREPYVSIESGPHREQGETVVCWFTTEEAAVAAWLRNAEDYARQQNAKVLRWRRRPGVEAGPKLVSLDFDAATTTPVLVPTFAIRSRMLASDKPAVFGIDPTHPDGVRDFFAEDGGWAPPEINTRGTDRTRPSWYGAGSPDAGPDAMQSGLPIPISARPDRELDACGCVACRAEKARRMEAKAGDKIVWNNKHDGYRV